MQKTDLDKLLSAVKASLDPHEDGFNNLRKEFIDLCAESATNDVPPVIDQIPKREDIDTKWHVAPLAVALFKKDFCFFESLLVKGIKPSGRFLLSGSETTLLHEAVRDESYSKMLSLLLKNVDVISYTKNRETPLYLACEYGNELAVEIILHDMQEKADRNFEILYLKSLGLAAMNGHAGIVKVFLKNMLGLELNNITEKLGLSVMYSALNGRKLNVVRELCSMSYTPQILEQKSPDQLTPLLQICCSKSLDTEYLKIILDAGADINYSHVNSDKVKMTALKYAAETGQSDKLELLLKRKAIMESDENEVRELVLCCHSKSGECANLLINAGAPWKDPQLSPKGSMLRVLDYAVERSAPEVLKVLVEKGDTLCNDLLYKVCDVESTVDSEEISDILLTNGLNSTQENDEKVFPLFKLIQNQKPAEYNKVLIKFLQHTPPPNEKTMQMIQYFCTSKLMDDVPMTALVLLHIASYPVAESLLPLDLILRSKFSVWLMQEANQPQTLKRLSRALIRSLIGPVKLKMKCQTLPLPRLMTDYLLIPELEMSEIDLKEITDWD